jgi:hypothetical protein
MLLQDWVSLCGSADGTTAVTFLPHRSKWAWLGAAQGVLAVVEVKELSGEAGHSGPPTLRIETSADESGPWEAVSSITTVGDTTIVLRREPGGTASQTLRGFLRWAVAETAGGGDWRITFRITAVVEAAG